MKKILVISLFIGLSILLGQFTWTFFEWRVDFLGRCPVMGPPSLLVIYGGDQERIEFGLKLERRCAFDYFCVSDSTLRELQPIFTRWGKPLHAQLLLEPEARSTTQNARYIARLVRRRKIASVALVTDWSHMPRALFIQKLALFGEGVTVYPVQSSVVPQGFWHTRVFWKETAKFWGSLFTWRPVGKET